MGICQKWVSVSVIFLSGVISFILMNYISFLVFHVLIEFFSIIIGSSIFVFFWLSRHRIENNFYSVFGLGYFSISVIDMLHTLTYTGMDIFAGSDSNIPTQLWIAARYIQLLTIFGAFVAFKKRISRKIIIVVYIAITLLVITSIFIIPVFPICYMENLGLSPFKKISEYLLSAGFSFAIYLLYRNRDLFPNQVRNNLYVSFIFTAISELAFSFYISVFGISNVIGHILKLFAFIYVFNAILDVGLKEPFEIVFRELKQREKELQLKFEQIKTLSGLLPICANCKKIRDDIGYWHTVEDYLCEHTTAEFTHSICPECRKILYKELDME